MTQDFQRIFSDACVSYDGHRTVVGLTHPVEILRDSIGVPHIYARSVIDGFFAQGFVHAQDRLWQMEYDRLRAYGRLSEVMGSQTVDQDILWRRLRLEYNAQRDFQQASPEVQSMFTAYAEGVNAYLRLETFPPECQILHHVPKPWEKWDSIAVFKVRHMNMGRWEHKLWRMRIASQFGTQKLQLLVPTTRQYNHLSDNHDVFADIDLTTQIFGSKFIDGDLDEGGSNNWVLSGARTVSGMPILAGDPHRGLEVPNVYYQSHLKCDDFDSIGFSFPGVPGFPHFGHNARVAWSITHAAADTQDIFIEALSSDRQSYRRGTEWVHCPSSQEQLAVLGESPLNFEIRETDEGPIIQEFESIALVLKAVSLQVPNRTWQALLSMLYAEDIHELDAAMEDWADPVNNLLYADTAGNIGYRMRGKLPIRPLANGWLPAPAASRRFTWSGYVPFESMYRVVNPKSGYIVTANNQVVNDDYPYYIALDFAAAHRKERIEDLILSRDRWAASEMTEIHQDVVSRAAQKFLRQLSCSHPSSLAGKNLKALLSAWDSEIRKDSVIPTAYNTVRRTIVANLIASITDTNFLQRWKNSAPLAWQAGRLTSHLPDILEGVYPEIHHYFRGLHLDPDVLGTALDETGRQLGLDSDGAVPTWGSAHILQPSHPLSQIEPALSPWVNPQPISMDGDADTVQAASYSINGFNVTGTSVARYAFDLSNWDNSGWSVPLGVSGVGQHPHALDQTSLWRDHRLYPMHYSLEQVRRNTRYVMTLFPAD
jgi:penicillin amidase